jgi:membrane-bound metal-dependent hydrolase YbcI (DUF457 family)
MTGKWHRATAASFAVFCSSLVFGGYVTLNYPENALVVLVIFSAGVMAGSSAPDWLEMPLVRKGVLVGRLIKHRTITHWFPAWIFFGWWVHAQQFPWQVDVAVTGFVMSGLLHILMDSLSVSGVPILLPFAKCRRKLSLYSTGRFSELVSAFFVLGLFFSASYVIVNNKEFFS